MPGLRLTPTQACRLWGLDAASCDALLRAVMDEDFLFRTSDGTFVRVEHAIPLKTTTQTKTTRAMLKPCAMVVAA